MGKSGRIVRLSAVLVAVLVTGTACAASDAGNASGGPSSQAPGTPSTSGAPVEGGTAADTTAPHFTWMISSVATDNWDLSAAWGSADAESGVDYTTARWRSQPIGGAWSPWHQPDTWAALPARAEVTMHLRPGMRYEVQAQAVDKAGNRSDWEQVGGAKRSAA